MKIERIALNKLKVTVTHEDLLLHGLSFEAFTADSPRVQDFFWNLIQRAEHETDFEIEEGRVIIEAMPLKNNGLVIFLTKPETGSFHEQSKLRRVRYRVKSARLPRVRGPVLIYRFENFDDLCALVKNWKYGDVRSSLFALGKDYILTLSHDTTVCTKRAAEAQLLEFGCPAHNLTEPYLEEHAKKICDGDAFDAIRRHF
ncbi:MAG: adaptor protein MecA [Ruminococcaceae bacterium]|nr:adaptor protein MecA [Oscillospiraceae bacterium]